MVAKLGNESKVPKTRQYDSEQEKRESERITRELRNVILFSVVVFVGLTVYYWVAG